MVLDCGRNRKNLIGVAPVSHLWCPECSKIWCLIRCPAFHPRFCWTPLCPACLCFLCFNKCVVCVPQERHPGDSKNYNECIRHETMRVAVCDMLEGKVPCPEALWSENSSSFWFQPTHFSLSVHVLIRVYMCVSGAWWRNPSWNIMISTRECVKSVCICRVRTCRWLFTLIFVFLISSAQKRVWRQVRGPGRTTG